MSRGKTDENSYEIMFPCRGECQVEYPRVSSNSDDVFLINVNVMPEEVSNYINLFADDAQVIKHAVNNYCCRELQEDLDKLHKWSQK